MIAHLDLMVSAALIATDWQFQLFGLVFMATLAIIPQHVIYAFSIGRVRQLSSTGVTVLRLIGGISALLFLYDLVANFSGTL